MKLRSSAVVAERGNYPHRAGKGRITVTTKQIMRL